LYEGAPCDVVFGPVAPDLFFRYLDVAEIKSDQSTVRVFHVLGSGGDSAGPGPLDFDVDGTTVEVSDFDGVSATWSVPESTAGDRYGLERFSFESDDLPIEDVDRIARGAVPAVGIQATAEAIAAAIHGEVTYAGPATAWDIGISYADRWLYQSSTPVADTAYALSMWYADGEKGTTPTTFESVAGVGPAIADDGYFVIGDQEPPPEVDATAFVSELRDLIGDSQPLMSGEEAPWIISRDCSRDPGNGPRTRLAADFIQHAEVVDRANGYTVRLTFRPDAPEPGRDVVLLEVQLGRAVRLAAVLPARNTLPAELDIDATMTHEEATLFADALNR
jgi:hypothetical protein